MTEFGISFYLYVFRKWIILVLVVMVVAVGFSSRILNSRELTYEAKTLITVGGFLQSPNPEYNELRVGVELARTYARLVETTDILQQTIDTLGLDMSIAQLRNMIEITNFENTFLLEIAVTHPNPDLAAEVANEVSNQLVINSPSNLTPRMQSQRLLAEEQIDRLNTQLIILEEELELTNEELDQAQGEDNEQLIAETRQRRTELIEQITQITATISSFSATIAQIEQLVNSVNIIENAEIPSTPVARSTFLFTILAALSSGTIVAGLALLWEANNAKIHSKKDAVRMLELPIIGTASKLIDLRTGSMNASTVLDEFQVMWTNLKHGTSDKNPICYIITGATDREKSETLLLNLAITTAKSGNRVLIVDVNLRQSKLSQLLNIESPQALSSLVEMDIAEYEASTIEQRFSYLDDVIVQAETDNLEIILAGSSDQNPVKLLESQIANTWLNFITSLDAYDLILLNTAPILDYTDTAILATNTKIDVLITVRQARTNVRKAIESRDRVAQVGGHLKGIIYSESGDLNLNMFR